MNVENKLEIFFPMMKYLGITNGERNNPYVYSLYINHISQNFLKKISSTSSRVCDHVVVYGGFPLARDQRKFFYNHTRGNRNAAKKSFGGFNPIE